MATKYDVPFSSPDACVLLGTRMIPVPSPDVHIFVGNRMIPYSQLPVVETSMMLIAEIGRLRAEVDQLKVMKADKRKRS